MPRGYQGVGGGPGGVGGSGRGDDGGGGVGGEDGSGMFINGAFAGLVALYMQCVNHVSYIQISIIEINHEFKLRWAGIG